MKIHQKNFRKLSLIGMSLLCQASSCGSAGRHDLVVPDNICEFAIEKESLASFFPAGGELQGDLSGRNNDITWSCLITATTSEDQGAIELSSEITTQQPNLLEGETGSEFFEEPEEISLGEAGYVDGSRLSAYSSCRHDGDNYFRMTIGTLGPDPSDDQERREALERLGRSTFGARLTDAGCIGE
jgi:hypothetical protein